MLEADNAQTLRRLERAGHVGDYDRGQLAAMRIYGDPGQDERQRITALLSRSPSNKRTEGTETGVCPTCGHEPEPEATLLTPGWSA